MTKPFTRVLLAAAVLAAGMACAAQPLGAASAPAGPAAIQGPTWRLTDLRGTDAAALPSGARSVTARFQDGRIDGFSGCNRYFGSYAFRQGRLVIGPLAGSMMACDPASMALETAVHRALAGTFRPVRTDDRLQLLSDHGDAVLAFKAEPAPALVGLRSNITGFNNGRQAVVSPLLGVTRLQRQHLLGPVQGLDLALLIDTEHDRVLRRRQIQTDHIDDLRLQLGIGGER